MTCNWTIYECQEINPEILKLAQGDTLIARLLSNRGINNPKLAQYFLDLKNVKVTHPLEIPEMDKAFARIQKAIEKQEQILIYGDYDVDGTSSVALLYRAFKMIGINVNYYIPSRHSEGYGLNNNAIKTIREEMNIDLMITCDCGISNYAEVEYAQSINLDVIVTDHHSLPEQSPPGIANCNPKTLPPEHPLHYLPGVGVAYKLAELILEHYLLDPTHNNKIFTTKSENRNAILSRNNDFIQAQIHSLLDLVALGMIADLAPLKAENRYLVDIGLKVLAETEKVGIRELMRVCGIKLDPDAEHIGFGLAPRINAAGRLTDAKQAVRLMITENYDEAKDLAEELDASNKDRRQLCDDTFEAALEAIEKTLDLTQDLCIPIAQEGWHHGVIGIVASRLVERFNLPVFIMAIEEKITKGSVRGINLPELDVFEEMNTIQTESQLFVKYGGHKAAAGFSCKKEDTPRLIATIKAHFNKRLSNSNLRKCIKIDTCLKLTEINSVLISRLEKLAPYGIENPQPIFISGPLILTSKRMLGNAGKHIKLFLKENPTDKRPIEAVIWNRAEEFLESYSGKINPQISIVYTPKTNEFQGQKSIQLDVRDWKDPQDVDEAFFARFKKQEAKLIAQ